MADPFSVDTLLGPDIAHLVGFDVGPASIAWRQPAGRGITRSPTGLLAGVPALLSGSANCGQVILNASGVQAESVVVTAWQLLLPAAVLALVGSLVLVSQRVQPDAAVPG